MCLTVPSLKEMAQSGLSDRGWDEEAFGEFGVDDDFVAGIQFLDKVTLDVGVWDDVIIDVATEGAGGFGEVLPGLLRGEDGAVVAFFELVVGQVFDNDRGFLLVDQSGGFGQEMLGVLAVFVKGG